jgi:hypothetical protein
MPGEMALWNNLHHLQSQVHKMSKSSPTNSPTEGLFDTPCPDSEQMALTTASPLPHPSDAALLTGSNPTIITSPVDTPCPDSEQMALTTASPLPHPSDAVLLTGSNPTIITSPVESSNNVTSQGSSTDNIGSRGSSHDTPISPINQYTSNFNPIQTISDTGQQPPPITHMPTAINDSYTTYKKQRLIDGSVYILKSTCTEPVVLPTLDAIYYDYKVFSAFLDLPPTDTTLLQ